MILSNVEIQQAIDDGDLIIDPDPQPRRQSIQEPSCPYNTTSVDLHLGSELSVPTHGEPFAFDLRHGRIAEFLAKHYQREKIGEGGYILDPGKFILGGVRERIALPIREGRPCLAARIEGRSSYARCGLIIHFTAPTIHAGFAGNTIALEMKNLGEYPITLRTGVAIAQLIIERVSGVPFLNPSQFQNQRSPTGTS